MKIKVNLPIGANVAQIEGEASDFKDMIKKLSSFEGIPQECGHCQSKNLWPRFRSPQGNTYYSIVCNACGWEFQYGQRKEGGGLFPKEWKAPYDSSVAKGAEDVGKSAGPRDEVPAPTDADIADSF